MDGYGAPPRTRTQQWVFGPTGNSGDPDFQQWSKPRGHTMLSILCIGAGAGGGGGAGNTAGSNAGGGGGGASGGIVRLEVPLIYVPQTLWILVGYGGLGGAGGTTTGSNGGNGRQSRVAVYPSITTANILCISSNTSAGGGTGGDRIGGTVAGGTATTVASLSDMPLGHMGISAFSAGQGGQNSGATGISAFTIDTTKPLLAQPGLGGGGRTNADTAGGGYAAIGSTPWLAIAGPTGSVAGSDGSFQQGLGYGGCGGGASNSTVGGAGGGAACVPGAGGGGGGGGVTTGGSGGQGGPGRIILTCW